METIKDFYDDYKDESYLTEVLELSAGLDMDLLEKASSQCLRHLRVLCDGKEEVMIQVLQLFISLPGARKRWEQQKSNRRADDKERDQTERRLRQKALQKVDVMIDVAPKVNPRINRHELEKATANILDEEIRDGWSELQRTYTTGKPLFNRIIALIFTQCRGVSDRTDNGIYVLIAAILKSLRILNSRENNYTRRDILRFVTQCSQPT